MADLFQNIFHLPASCVFHTVMPKNAFEKNNSLSAAEKRLINIPFLPLQSVLKASLNQSRSFIPPKVGKEMDYEDILFFSIKLKPTHLEIHSDKLIQLYQKYILKNHKSTDNTYHQSCFQPVTIITTCSTPNFPLKTPNIFSI